MNIIDIVDSLPKHDTLKYSTRALSRITGVVVHHTTGAITSTGTLPPAIARFHVSRGFPGIGYHYFIDSDGQVYLTQRLETVSWHCGDPNTTTIGIALRGDFTSVFPTGAQQTALVELLRHIRGMPEMSIMHIAGHGQYPGASRTACPGATWANWLPGIVNASAGTGAFTPATMPTAPAPAPGSEAEPMPIVLSVVRQVNIRAEPRVSALSLGRRAVGETIIVLDIDIESARRVWVRDVRGWSALVYDGTAFMTRP